MFYIIQEVDSIGESNGSATKIMHTREAKRAETILQDDDAVHEASKKNANITCFLKKRIQNSIKSQASEEPRKLK